MNELISIIVPVYNVEKYLERCIKSIIDQTYKKLDIILVDDGSTDKSGQICDNYIRIDSRIRVIHKENGGLSDARNVGMEEAKGKLISFIDSDDFIDRNMIKILYENMINTNSDISICGVRKVNEQEKIDNESLTINDKIKVFDPIEVYRNLYNDLALETVVAWNKLYKKELFDTIKYPKGKIHEDNYVIHYLISKTKKVVYTYSKLYYYVQRKNSIMKKKFNISRLDELQALEERMEFFKKLDLQELYEKTMYRYCASNRHCYIKIENKEVKDNLNERFKLISKKLKKGKYISKKEKIKLFILENFLWIYKLSKMVKQ